jgi:hypothetical protein
MRLATAILILALVTLVAAALWGPPAAKGRADEALATTDPEVLLGAFEEESPPAVTIEIQPSGAQRPRRGLSEAPALDSWRRSATFGDRSTHGGAKPTSDEALTLAIHAALDAGDLERASDLLAILRRSSTRTPTDVAFPRTLKSPGTR